MSDYHTGLLGYGYDLGTSESVNIVEAEDFGDITLDWVKRDEDGYMNECVPDAFSRRLHEAITGLEGFDGNAYDAEDDLKLHLGVWIEQHGWLVEGDSPSYALLAYLVEVDGGDAKALNLDELNDKVGELELKAKLARAIEILGITPKDQEGPSWLLMASR